MSKPKKIHATAPAACPVDPTPVDPPVDPANPPCEPSLDPAKPCEAKAPQADAPKDGTTVSGTVTVSGLEFTIDLGGLMGKHTGTLTGSGPASFTPDA